MFSPIRKGALIRMGPVAGPQEGKADRPASFGQLRVGQEVGVISCVLRCELTTDGIGQGFAGRIRLKFRASHRRFGKGGQGEDALAMRHERIGLQAGEAAVRFRSIGRRGHAGRVAP